MNRSTVAVVCVVAVVAVAWSAVLVRLVSEL